MAENADDWCRFGEHIKAEKETRVGILVLYEKWR
jgi:hypothetical protein